MQGKQHFQLAKPTFELVALQLPQANSRLLASRRRQKDAPSDSAIVQQAVTSSSSVVANPSKLIEQRGSERLIEVGLRGKLSPTGVARSPADWRRTHPVRAVPGKQVVVDCVCTYGLAGEVRSPSLIEA